MPVPIHLVFIDISHNNFDSLPDWICDLPQIDCLRINNNRLTHVPERLFNVQSIRFLCCENNRIKSLPNPSDELNLVSCVLYNNQLTELPVDFLRKCSRLRHLNLSFNRLTSLPAVNTNVEQNQLNTLRMSGNRLDETVVPILMKMKRLRTLDLSRNKLRYFDDSALGSLILLEELNLSSNELTALSSSIFSLPSLQVLKAHSNRIKLIPNLSLSHTLQLVDLSNNELGTCATNIATGTSLSLLDLTCNSALNFTSGTLRKSYKKPLALFDIGDQRHDRVEMGFSETSGIRNKLCIRRVHCGDVFGMIDGSSNYELPRKIQLMLKQSIMSKENDYNLSEILLEVHEMLGEPGERLGATAVLVGTHLEKLTEPVELDEEQYDQIRFAGGFVDEVNGKLR
ncbi:leucine Rich repeat-containing domain protein [Dictyocaulus viviparus]|uniref:Leucine Rich repeat-containing domain protein n=1 Tax=Dictyocaulus viviparus TaxID=29172 RepID=A0A0D8XEX6_DICVI|nr:leucine Rich repeat-containing domain protein [Dictyocaulus viviparus]